MAEARLETLLEEVISRNETWSLVSDHVEVPTMNGERRQTIRVRRNGGQCELSSVVLPAETVTRTARGWRNLALRAWLRNEATNVVDFTFDAEDRLIGLVRHPESTLDVEELELYLTVLAAECDRFEFLLGGEDLA